MKEINIKVKNVSSRQWPLLLLELNLVAKTWRRYGPVMNIKARNFRRVVKWGEKRHDESDDN